MIYLQLFFEFFKIGLFAIGGGLATIPFLRELADKYGWFTQLELVDIIAISESTPGPIGINMATYVGYKTASLTGGVVAVLGIIAPSIIIIIIIARYYMKFSEQPIVQSAFHALRPAAVGLIGAAGLQVAKISLLNVDKFLDTYNISHLFNIKTVILFLGILYFSNKYKRHPIFYLIGAAVVGIIFRL
jgi:chromate transporter